MDGLVVGGCVEGLLSGGWRGGLSRAVSLKVKEETAKR